MPASWRAPYNESMPSSCHLSDRPSSPAQPARWSVAGLLLEALAGREFDRLAECFEPHAEMRALLPRGPVVYRGVQDITGAFRLWFGSAEDFEVLDATVGEVGSRLHASWRLRVSPTPRGDDGPHLIEQQVYAHAVGRIESIDLLCSGFQPEGRR